jgi:arylsulfatase
MRLRGDHGRTWRCWQFIDTFREFPPRQKPSSFSVDDIMEQLKKPTGG